MISALSMIILLLVFNLFTLLTIHFLIRIKNKIVPSHVFVTFLYYLSLVSYVITFLEGTGPYALFDIVFQTLLLGIVEAIILVFWLRMKERQFLSINKSI